MDSKDEDLTAKMVKLEKTIQTFRAEVNMKMSIVEQVLNNRNEQFQIQKDLLEREHSLYQTVLVHWKNIADMAANGLSLHFAQAGDEENLENNPYFAMGKSKKRLSSAKARRERSKRIQAKRMRREGDDGNSFNEEFDTSGNENQEDIPYDEDADDYGLEKKVYVNFYTTGTVKKGENSNNAIWKYYLREENGLSAMCKLCENEGTQNILKIRRGGTWNLYRHLKKHIPDINIPQQDDSANEEEQEGKVSTFEQPTKKEFTGEEDSEEQHDVEDQLNQSADQSANPDDLEVPMCRKRRIRSHDSEERLPGWMQYLEPFFDFVDFTGKKHSGTPEVVMRCKECAMKKSNHKGIRGRGSHNFARHLKIHPQSRMKYMSAVFECKTNTQKEQQQQPPSADSILPFPN